ncbi:MCE family protein [Kutzneria albida]|uniref:Mce/MlaD domain-containing protein n=1 Tax=Kutzneria albida DSM 43870 TaxID=1449976 RepID=W5WJZ9_9PSEU|nr:MCE family protein [Kutzneria albida]AHI01071.1 hypothetical protein KALB_7713 [Kutzneria albida DSM 43870]
MVKAFGERDPVRLGVVGTIVLIVVLALALSGVAWRGGRQYTAQFGEVGGLRAGDPVVVSGSRVGRVDELVLRGDHVDVTFSVTDARVRLGEQTGAAIKAVTALGRKELALRPSGPGELSAPIPTARTIVPYDLTEALSDLTSTTSKIDTGQLATALDTLATTFQHTPAPLRAAMAGLSRLSSTISSRDGSLRELLTHANGVSSVLAQRNGELVKVFGQGATLLAELNRRSATIRSLLADSVAVSNQVVGLVQDNKAQLEPSLRQLDDLLKLLQDNRDHVDQILKQAGPVIRELGESVGSGPFTDTYVHNIIPTNLVPLLPELLSRGSR